MATPKQYFSTPRKASSHDPSRSSTSGVKRKTKTSEVEAAIRGELRYAIFADTPNFIETLFPTDLTIVDSIYDSALSEGLYTRDDATPLLSRWSAIPVEPVTEHTLYDPFVAAANFITERCPTRSPGTPSVRWITDPNRAPQKVDTLAADMRPDIISVIGFPTPTDPSVKDWAPWRRILVPMEVKKASIEELPATLQVLKYQRQLFRECVDRRFIFGIVLSRRNVSVYLADRSGVLGSQIFDMHEVCPLFPSFYFRS